MNKVLLEFLVCPQCLPEEKPLKCKIDQQEQEDIIKGALICGQCGAGYPIEDGIPFLLPVDFSNSFSANFKYEAPPVLSSYLWSHYADLWADPDHTRPYEKWAELLDSSPGFALDAGCAVGRLVFELTKKADFVIGVDASSSFVKRARELKLKRKIHFNMKTEGMLEETVEVVLPESVRTDNAEFILADVQRLPFKSSLFSTTASLNIVDKVPSPITHLKEINRVALDVNSQLLFSDPFSWSNDITEPENWLGGVDSGQFPGMGIDNVRAILSGMSGHLDTWWEIVETGHVWWKIRNHRNHFELIKSLYLKAAR